VDNFAEGHLFERLELAAALGSLLNSISHELSNHLTNLILATENARHDQTSSSFEILERQLKQTSDLSAHIQRLGTQNLAESTGPVSLAKVISSLAETDGFGRPHGERLEVDVISSPTVRSKENQVQLALALLLRTFPSGVDRKLRFCVDEEDVLRSRWSDEDQMVSMARIRIECGGVSNDSWPPFSVSDLVAEFYSGPKSVEEVCAMGAWEILRKVMGRPSARLALDHTDDGERIRIVLWLPLAVDWTR